MPKTKVAPDMQQLVLDCVSWRAYDHFLRACEDRHLRITYDQGTLEVMTLSFQHERLKHLLMLLVVTLAEVLGKDIAGYGSLTMRRRKKDRGLEPDECFWVQHAARMRNITRFSLRRDPPPDLALEVDVTQSVLNRI